jgi:hypothetical protein
VRDPQTSRFAGHVDEVVDLDERGAPFEAVEAHIDSLTFDVVERFTLRLLAWHLAEAADAGRVTGDTVVAMSHA